MSLVPREDAPTAEDAEEALRRLRDEVFIRLQPSRRDRDWQLALGGLADEVEDVIVTIRRLATHERVWRESKGTSPVEPPISHDPNENMMQQMARGRSDLRAFILLLDVLLDNAAKALRPLGASKRATENFLKLTEHLEASGACWSRALRPLAAELAGLQWSIGYFRDKFVAHRGLLPVGAIYLPDGKIRLGLVGGTKSPAELARGGRELARVVPVLDNPLDPVYDVRLDIAFAALRADPERREDLKALLEEFGAISPDPYETAIEVADALDRLFKTAGRELPA
jgi:hypothetical protein